MNKNVRKMNNKLGFKKSLTMIASASLLLIASQSFANTGSNPMQNAAINSGVTTYENCQQVIQQYMDASIQRENAILKSTVSQATQAIKDLSEEFGATASCVGDILNTSGDFGISVPGLSQIKQSVMNQIDQQIANACNAKVSSIKGKIGETLGKYNKSIDLGSLGFPDIGAGVRVGIQ